MSLENLRASLPEYAKDIKVNLSNLAAEETLTQQQLWGCMLACALTTRQAEVVNAMEAEVEGKLSPEAVNAARAAATIMAMNNVYYRSVHLLSNKEYQSMQGKLRMTVIANPGVDKVDFELWSLAVSAINGCGMCLDAHEAQLLKHSITPEQIQTALRIAAVVNAAAQACQSASLTAGIKIPHAA